jgi:replicative superfamily II helicase
MVFRGLAASQVYRPKLEANQRRGRAGRTGPGAYGPQSFVQWEIRPGTHVTSM